jgi:hypothetical protein
MGGYRGIQQVGATLSVEPGVHINGNNFQFNVEGTVQAIGSKEELIILDEVYFTGPAKGTVSLEYVDWKRSGRGAYLMGEASFQLSHSKISSALILLKELKQNIIINNNLFYNGGHLYITNGTGKVTITGNTFYNDTGYDLYFECLKNTCTENTLTLTENNFLNNNHPHVHLTGDARIILPAPNNYWGDTSYSRIQPLILDGYNSYGRPNMLDIKDLAMEPFPVPYDFPTIQTPSLDNKTITVNSGPNVTGIAPNSTKAVLKIKTISGREIWYETDVVYGRFTFDLPKQEAGTMIELFSYTSTEQSQSVLYTVESSFIKTKPFVYPVNTMDSMVKGFTSPHTLVEIKKNDQWLGSTTSDENGNFEWPLENVSDGDILTLYTKSGEETSDVTTLDVKTREDQVPPSIQVVLATHNQQILSGKTEPGARVIVRINHKHVTEYSTNGTGSILQSLPIQEDDKIEVWAVDTEGNVSDLVTHIARDWRPPLIVASNARAEEQYVKGRTESNVKVEIFKGAALIGSAKSNSDGSYSVPVGPLSPASYLVKGTDSSGNSKSLYLFVIDETLPLIHKVDSSYEGDTTVTGVAEPDSWVRVWKNNVLFYSGAIADSSGRFSVPVSPLSVGDELIIVATYRVAASRSEPVIQTVHGLVIPDPPVVHPVKDFSTYVTGTSRENGLVKLYKGENLVGEGTAKEDGVFRIDIAPQEAGTILTLIAYNERMQPGNPTHVTVEDGTAPDSPVVSPIEAGSGSITGQAEPSSKITIMINGTFSTEVITNETGSFQTTISPLLHGEIVEVMAEDRIGNKSVPTIVIVKDTKSPELEIQSISNLSTEIIGISNEGGSIEVTREGVVISSRIIEANTGFSIPIPQQTEGIEMVIIVRDDAGNETVINKVVEDVIAPLAPQVLEITDQSTLISGKAEPLSTVVILQDGNKLSETTANETGDFEAAIPLLQADSQLEVLSKDPAGNESPLTIVTIRDVTLPTAVVHGLTNKSTTITGVSNENGKVEIWSGGKVIATSAVIANEPFSIAIPVQKEGQTVSVVAIDNAGNKSKSVSTVVKDVIAPSKPVVNKITDQTKEVTGNSEVGSTVKVYGGTKMIGTGTSTGSFKVKIPIQKAGSVLSIKVFDKAGNVSQEVKLTVVDKTAPTRPTFNTIKNTTRTVTGKAEPYSKVRLYSGSKLLGYGTTTSKGTFSFKISGQKIGAKLTATATDRAGNKSSTTAIIVEDGVAPSAPRVNNVYKTSSYVSGKAEAYSTITIKIGSKKIATGKANKYGTYKVKIVRQKRGVTLNATAMDRAMNVSKATYVKVR